MSPESADGLLTHSEKEVTSDWLSRFKSATLTDYSHGVPPTFPTVFRQNEFDLVTKHGVHFKDLLHTDQEFEFHSEFRPGDNPVTKTILKEKKERKRGNMTMAFYLFESQVLVEETLRVVLRSTFLVRTTQ